MNRRAIILILAGAFGLAASASGGTYSGGTGEPNNPYRIETPNDLNDIGNHPEDWSSHFVMVNDINLAEYTGTEFNIIGTDSDQPFTGVFDGNNHRIFNFAYTWADGYQGGIFGVISGSNASVNTLSLVNPNIDAGSARSVGCLAGQLTHGASINECSAESCQITGMGYRIGGLVGSNSGLISNCSVSINIVADDDTGGLVGYNEGWIKDCNVSGVVCGDYMVGGIVGSNWGYDIINCSYSGNVLGNEFVGGLVGYTIPDKTEISNCHVVGFVQGAKRYTGGLVGCNSFSTILRCYAHGVVDGNSATGGLVGRNNRGVISDSYSLAVVEGNDNAGGFIGEDERGQVYYCYAAGQTSGDANVGSFVGHAESAHYTKCFWDNTVNPLLQGFGDGTADPNVIGKSTEDMQKESTFTDAGWDFVGVWNIGENQTYPFLRVYPAGDLNHDGRVNLLDFVILALHWLEGVE